jgi:hypothetical protein
MTTSPDDVDAEPAPTLHKDNLPDITSGLDEDQQKLLEELQEGDQVVAKEDENEDTEAAAAAASEGSLSKKHARSESPNNNTTSTSLQEPLAGGLTLIHDGPPLENLPGGWPEGWRQRIVFRKTGGRKGPRKDSYFYTPLQGYELLGVKKVKLFLQKLKECEGDEDKALECMVAPL